MAKQTCLCHLCKNYGPSNLSCNSIFYHNSFKLQSWKNKHVTVQNPFNWSFVLKLQLCLYILFFSNMFRNTQTSSTCLQKYFYDGVRQFIYFNVNLKCVSLILTIPYMYECACVYFYEHLCHHCLKSYVEFYNTKINFNCVTNLQKHYGKHKIVVQVF